MAEIDKSFGDICKKILTFGKTYRNVNRNVERLQIPSYTFKHSFKNGFPALTNKKLYWKAVVGELIWFLTGDSNIKYLVENGIPIWNKDAYNWYLKAFRQQHRGFSQNEFTYDEFINYIKQGKDLENIQGIGISAGDVGRNYGVQWRHFNGVDQIKKLVEDMKKDIMSSRLKVNAWNPAELELTTLPPCHSEFQVVGVPLENGKFGFELHWTQRSVDTFLG